MRYFGENVPRKDGTANFTNSELQRYALDVEAILANPDMRKFVDWVAKKDPDFHASPAKKKR